MTTPPTLAPEKKRRPDLWKAVLPVLRDGGYIKRFLCMDGSERWRLMTWEHSVVGYVQDRTFRALPNRYYLRKSEAWHFWNPEWRAHLKLARQERRKFKAQDAVSNA